MSLPTAARAKAAFVVSLSLVFVSLALFLHAYGGYETTQHLVLPNVDALSPTATYSQVEARVMPLLPVGAQGDVARSVLQGHADHAATLHKLWVTQATATARMSGIQLWAWGFALAAGIFLTAALWPRKTGAA